MNDESWDDSILVNREAHGEKCQQAHRIFCALFLLMAGAHVKAYYLHHGNLQLKHDVTEDGMPVRHGTEGWELGNKGSKTVTHTTTVCFKKGGVNKTETVRKRKVNKATGVVEEAGTFSRNLTKCTGRLS